MRTVYLLLNSNNDIVIILSSKRAAIRAKSFYKDVHKGLYILPYAVYSYSDI